MKLVLILIVSLVLTVCVAVFFFRPVFGGQRGFLEALRLWFQPNLLSIVRDEWEDDWTATMKVALWLFLSLGTGVSVFLILWSALH